MSAETEKRKVRVFVPMTFEGVSSVAILEEITQNIEWDIQYTRSLDFREYEQFKDTDVVLVLGCTYQGGTLPEEFFDEVDVPFMDFIHCSTFGEPLPGTHIISIVHEAQDPIKSLSDFLYNNPASSVLTKNITFTNKAWQMIEAVNAYRIWQWDNNGMTKALLALYFASHKWLPNMIRGLTYTEMVKNYAPVIKGQLQKMDDFLKRKREVTKTFQTQVEGQACVVKVVFSDEYINELANDLLNSVPLGTSVIVCVGRATKSNDILSIRTRGIHAGRVAHLINEGNGKENVASVFTGIGYAELVGKSIVHQLSMGEA
jgi:hypothetical protein